MYCNYSKNKFSNEVTFIKPCWMNIPEGKYTNIVKQSPEDGEYKQIMLHENNINAYPLTTTSEGRFLWHCYWCEHDYFDLLSQGWTPQQARAVLPNSLKTELVMTGFISDWKHFFELRDSNKAHPQARELASPLHKEFIEKGLIK
jgi:thymidylate synthase (FAD)